MPLRMNTLRLRLLAGISTLLVVVLVRLLPASQAGREGAKLEAVLRSMDQAAARFSGVTGDLEYTKVTVIVNDYSTEKGKIFFAKAKGKTRVMLAFEEPAEKYVLFEGSRVSLYRPKIAEVEEYEISQRSELLEQFLLLGFGTSGAALQKSYQVTLLGEESLDGKTAVHLGLVPQSNQVTAQLKKIELWLSPDTWQPVQQKFFEPSGDYLIARYRDLQLNVKIPDKNFKLPLRGKVRTIRPQACD